MNFTRASEQLNITQPAVSQHIRFLEKHYNTKLFHYEGKKLRLTGAGEILRNASLTMMHDEISMQSEMQKSEEAEEIRFGATRTVGDTLMGGILEKYLREYPDADIHMVVENTRELLERLDEKKAEEFRASVLADPAGEWVRLMGGTDRRGSSGSSADNTGSAGH